ncbi:AtpZ/AtpI family protein [Reyranella sp.]|uniref:AtpZ/AtpI family protein n=1 Tax=Reyranella sp. TaxID=1929291 RepID=UPI003BAC0D92
MSDPSPGAPPPEDPLEDPPEDPMVGAARREGERRRRWLSEGAPSVARYVGQIGVLGWIVVTPTLLGLFAGRWLDHRFGTGIFWSAPLLFVGIGIGAYSAWKWIHRQ